MKQNNMKFVGITGGVGAGKSTVLSYLKSLEHTKVLLADEVAHLLMEPGTDCYAELQKAFAEDAIFDENGRIVKEKMAQLIFQQEEKRNLLNGIVHPAVKRYIIKEYESLLEEGSCRLFVLEAALLIEEKYDEVCDELWYIYTSEDNRRKRLKETRHYSDEKIDGIFQSQLPEQEFRSHCVVEIDNNGTKEETISQLKNILEERVFHE